MKKNNKRPEKNNGQNSGEDEFFVGMLVMGMIFLVLFIGIFQFLKF